MSVFTLKNWMNGIVHKELKAAPAKEKLPQEWGPQEQLIALQESHGLEGEALNAWCRERGVFSHHFANPRRLFYRYLFMDVFSRKIVGWQTYEEESSVLAGDLMRDIDRRENLAPNPVVLHSDNGGPMKGATMLATLQALGVAPSFSRPAVSNDNPYSESLFKTLKYRPAYPDKPFESLLAVRTWVDGFVRWYNFEHRHSAVPFVTPAERACGHEVALLGNRTAVYEAAKARRPNNGQAPLAIGGRFRSFT